MKALKSKGTGYQTIANGQSFMEDAKVNISVFPELKKYTTTEDPLVCLCIKNGGISTYVALTPDEARELAENLHIISMGVK